jgi:hypothetical protein
MRHTVAAARTPGQRARHTRGDVAAVWPSLRVDAMLAGMTTLSPQLALLFVVTSGVGVVMLMQGLRTSLLRRRTVRCHTCGRLRHGGVCECSRH